MFPSVVLPNAIQVVGCVGISHTFRTFEILSFKACVEDYHHNHPCSQCSPKFAHYVVHILDNCPKQLCEMNVIMHNLVTLLC